MVVALDTLLEMKASTGREEDLLGVVKLRKLHGKPSAEASRIEALLRSVDDTRKAAAERRYPKPFQQVIQELEAMADFAARFPKVQIKQDNS